MNSKLLPIPMCAVCNIPVERMELENNIMKNGIFAIAYCHGKSEICEIPVQFIIKNGSDFRPGIAFRNLLAGNDIKTFLPSVGELNKILRKELEKLDAKN